MVFEHEASSSPASQRCCIVTGSRGPLIASACDVESRQSVHALDDAVDEWGSEVDEQEPSSLE